MKNDEIGKVLRNYTFLRNTLLVVSRCFFFQVFSVTPGRRQAQFGNFWHMLIKVFPWQNTIMYYFGH
jgi:hypothetical protein